MLQAVDAKLPISYIVDLQKKTVSDAIEAQTALANAIFVSGKNLIQAQSIYKEAAELLASVTAAKAQLDRSKEVVSALSDLKNATSNIVAELAKNAEFKTGIAALVGTPAFPSGMISAFNTSEKEGKCPSGWKIFDEAGGRFIVGAGNNSNKDMNGAELTDHPSLNDDAAKAVGGEELHRLTVTEMPAHQHGIRRTQGKGGDGKYPNWSAMGNQLIQVVGESEPSGGDQPHNTMPPFVALYYCIRE